MVGPKTNERPGTRAVLRGSRMSAYKAREVLDLIRGQDVARAAEILRFSERSAATVIGKVLASAVANARENDSLDPEDLYVSACYADEGGTLKRWRPRARGRATRIRKRTCHITVIVGVMPPEMARQVKNKRSSGAAAARSRRRAESRRPAQAEVSAAESEPEETLQPTTEVEGGEQVADRSEQASRADEVTEPVGAAQGGSAEAEVDSADAEGGK